MEEYPEELRTPPVTLVSLVGTPELHSTISAFLHSEQPPINTLALPDFGKISIIAPKNKESSDLGKPIGGILKREWLAKHRTRAPAVVAAIFGSDRVTGDPAQWLQVCTDIDCVKAAVRGRNTKLVLVIVQPTIIDVVHDELMTSLRRRAEIDSKYIITLVLNDPLERKRSLQRLGAVFSELAIVYYREQGRRNKARIEKKSFNSADLHVRYCFKAAVFAEFRRDWAEALRLYNDAYVALYEMTGMPSELPLIQRLMEMKTVAEYLHFKVSTLLLHGGKVAEAVKWFHKHVASSEQLAGPTDIGFLHGEWLSRQFLVFAELLETSSTGGTALTEWDFRPAYYYQMSAHNLKRKQDSLERILLAPEMAEWRSQNESATAVESIVPSVFVGQFSRLLEDESNSLAALPIADAEYTAFALAEAKRFQDSFEIIALYRKSMESYTALKATRMSSFCANRMAKEYLSVGDFTNAKKTIDQILDLYRRESWLTLLQEALNVSRECSLKLGLVHDFIERSLELTALPIEKGQSLSHKGLIQEEVIGLLKSGSFESGAMSMKVDQSIDLEVNAESPLRTVFIASLAFHDQRVKPGSPAKLTLSLLSMLPQTIEIDQVEVQFNYSASNFTVGPISLTPMRWLHLTQEVQSAHSGNLDCLSVIAYIGQWCKIRLLVNSPQSIDSLSLPTSAPSSSSSSPLNLPDQVRNHPAETLILSAAGQKTILVDEPDPDIQLTVPLSSGPALVGEIYSIPFSVTSTASAAVLSSELKINLVDATAEAAAPEQHHVELLSINVQEGKHEDKIKKIRHSFGLVSVPLLTTGDSWSGDLHIQWHCPRVIIVFISLSYSNSSGQRINIHRNLQIEGKTPVTTDHRFISSFRSEPLLLSKLQTQSIPVSLPQNQTTVLVVSALNCCHVPLQLVSLKVEDAGELLLPAAGEDLVGVVIAPGEEFRRFFAVLPRKISAKIELGYACVKWSRLDGGTAVSVRQKLPEVAVEAPPLVVKVEGPAYAVLAEPFTLNVRVQNESSLLQEIKYSMGDCHGFVFSGPHQDNINVLPKSVHVASHKLIALTTGFQQLPHVNILSTRYSAKITTSVAASTVFVFPSSQRLV